MEMYQVRYFLAAAEQLNFTRAAERLHVAQPSLTRAIQKLEDELGGPLFRRERANTHLTELGRMMLPHLAASLAAAEAAKTQARSFSRREAGQLTLGASSAVCAQSVAPLLCATAREIAGLGFDVVIAPSADLEERLMGGELDAAFLTPLAGDAPGHERLDRHDVIDDPLVVAFSPEHRFMRAREVKLEDLDGEALVVRRGCGHEDAIAAAMEARAVVRAVRHRSDDERWMGEMVRAGLGVVLWPEAAAAAWGLPFRPLADLPVTFRVALTTVAGRRRSPALAALLRQAGMTASADLAWPVPAA